MRKKIIIINTLLFSSGFLAAQVRSHAGRAIHANV
jgi:hypothetical protein